jgi:hypothetical protein
VVVQTVESHAFGRQAPDTNQFYGNNLKRNPAFAGFVRKLLERDTGKTGLSKSNILQKEMVVGDRDFTFYFCFPLKLTLWVNKLTLKAMHSIILRGERGAYTIY